MKIDRNLTATALTLAAAIGVATSASAQQVTHETQEHHSTMTNTTVPGNVSTNKVKVVHVKKHVTAPAAKPAPGSTVHTTVTKSEHRAASSQSGN
jgi:Holliday junction resolvasome RuvABC endonuclease subunit